MDVLRNVAQQRIVVTLPEYVGVVAALPALPYLAFYLTSLHTLPPLACARLNHAEELRQRLTDPITGPTAVAERLNLTIQQLPDNEFVGFTGLNPTGASLLALEEGRLVWHAAQPVYVCTILTSFLSPPPSSSFSSDSLTTCLQPPGKNCTLRWTPFGPSWRSSLICASRRTVWTSTTPTCRKHGTPTPLPTSTRRCGCGRAALLLVPFVCLTPPPSCCLCLPTTSLQRKRRTT